MTLHRPSSDDTDIPVELWGTAVCRGKPTPRQVTALMTIRVLKLRLYRRPLWQDARRYLITHHGRNWVDKMCNGKDTMVEEMDGIQDILCKAAENEWFKYPARSRLTFSCFPVH